MFNLAIYFIFFIKYIWFFGASLYWIKSSLFWGPGTSKLLSRKDSQNSCQEKIQNSICKQFVNFLPNFMKKCRNIFIIYKRNQYLLMRSETANYSRLWRMAQHQNSNNTLIHALQYERCFKISIWLQKTIKYA